MSLPTGTVLVDGALFGLAEPVDYAVRVERRNGTPYVSFSNVGYYPLAVLDQVVKCAQRIVSSEVLDS